MKRKNALRALVTLSRIATIFDKWDNVYDFMFAFLQTRIYVKIRPPKAPKEGGMMNKYRQNKRHMWNHRPTKNCPFWPSEKGSAKKAKHSLPRKEANTI